MRKSTKIVRPPLRLPCHPYWHHVAVGVEGYGNGGVPEELLNELRVNVFGEQERCAGVAQVVEGDGGSPAFFRSGMNDR